MKFVFLDSHKFAPNRHCEAIQQIAEAIQKAPPSRHCEICIANRSNPNHADLKDKFA